MNEIVAESVIQEEQDAVAEARKFLNESLAKTAAMVVALHERFGKTIHHYAVEVTRDNPDLKDAVDGRADRLWRKQNPRSGGENGESQAPPPNQIRGAKSTLRRASDEQWDEMLADDVVRERVEKHVLKGAQAAARAYVEPMTKMVNQANADLAEAIITEFEEMIKELGKVPDADLTQLNEAINKYQLTLLDEGVRA